MQARYPAHMQLTEMRGKLRRLRRGHFNFHGLAVLLLALPAGAFAAANCAAITDPDQAAYCRALQQRSPARCVEIRDYGLRQQCRVQLGDGPAQCNAIPDPGQRETCKTLAR